MYDIYFLLRKKKFAIKLNRKLFNLGGGQQFKAVLHLLFLCLNPFLSLTHKHVIR